MIDTANLNTYREVGIAVLRQVFTDWIETLRQGVEKNLAEPGPYARVYTPAGAAGRFFGDYCNWQRIPQYRDFLFHSPAARIAAELMDSPTARVFHEHVLVKEPGTEQATPWHHDQPYYCIDGLQVCSLWIPLDPVPRDTCPEFIAGSHRWGRWFMPRKFVGADYDHSDARLEPMPDIDSTREQYDIRTWELEPGDALAFHFLTVHGAPPNRSTRLRRRGFAARWLGADTVYARRSGEMSPPFPGLEQRLKPGDPISGNEFPLLWPPQPRMSNPGASDPGASTQ